MIGIHIGFTGTQKGMTAGQKAEVERFLRAQPTIACFIHGACVGADDEADAIAARLGIYRVVFPAPEGPKRIPDDVLRSRGPVDIRPPKVPLKRNHDIVGMANILLGAPFSAGEVLRSGTWATIREAEKRQRAYYILYP